ncbi:MAG: class I SAM-dependent methyltransferase [Burkholderiales bacterium]|nr:class I SAM-dependent methyltransferase [Burkholderiales bacterium]
MLTDYSQHSAEALKQLDDLLSANEDTRWQGFYTNRARLCPFFEQAPDENLVAWIEQALIPPGQALDIGCGNGRNTIYLARQGFTATGQDLSESAITWARESVAQQHLAAQFVHASLFQTPPTPGHWDVIYDSGCFHHIAPHRRQTYVHFIADGLKPGGHFGLVCFAPEGGSGYTDEEIYAQGTLGGGLGYTDAALRTLWSPHFEIISLCRMRAHPRGSDRFGQPYLWAMLGRKR